jgi:cytochrome c556
MDTSESIIMAAVTLITNTLTALFTNRAAEAKARKEADAIVSDSLTKRTQQLFDNISHVMEDQQKEINTLKASNAAIGASLETCHRQHNEAMVQYNETLRRLEALESALKCA